MAKGFGMSLKYFPFHAYLFYVCDIFGPFIGLIGLTGVRFASLIFEFLGVQGSFVCLFFTELRLCEKVLCSPNSTSRSLGWKENSMIHI